MSRVSLSSKHAQLILDAWNGVPGAAMRVEPALKAIRSALSPKPRSSQVKKTAAKKRTKAKDTKSIRAAVMARAEGRCECCGAEETDFDQLELEHMHGKVRVKQSTESTWAVRHSCHQKKTGWKEGRDVWLERFIAHCRRNNLNGPGRRYAEDTLAAYRLSRGGES
jgi:5-methylcytosine-specific restriction endonuclease McrA